MDKYLIKSDCKKPVLYLRIEPEVYNNEISGRQGEPVRISRFGGNRSQSSHHYTRKPSVAVESALFSGYMEMGDMTDLEFRQMIERHGGCISIKPNARSLIIATRLKANKPLIRAIRPQWVLDSIANNRKQSKSKYLLVNQ